MSRQKGKPLIENLDQDSVPDKPKKRGGSHSAREKSLVGIVVHVTPEDYARLKTAAAAAGQALKEFCRLAALAAVR